MPKKQRINNQQNVGCYMMHHKLMSLLKSASILILGYSVTTYAKSTDAEYFIDHAIVSASSLS